VRGPLIRERFGEFPGRLSLSSFFLVGRFHVEPFLLIMILLVLVFGPKVFWWALKVFVFIVVTGIISALYIAWLGL